MVDTDCSEKEKTDSRKQSFPLHFFLSPSRPNKILLPTQSGEGSLHILSEPLNRAYEQCKRKSRGGK
ncbi:MAG TPA: hypothetical protein DCP92_07455 [Nitrospiraceae bacterium]|nr:hypothetical protein [Nitrospiraceae bacterium]